MISIPYTSTQKDAREKVEETFYAVSPFSAVPCSKNLCRVKPPPNSRVQVTPLERPVNRGVFGTCPVPSAVAFKNVTSGAPDADRWAAPQPERPMPNRANHASIFNHQDGSEGKPSIHRAHAER